MLLVALAGTNIPRRCPVRTSWLRHSSQGVLGGTLLEPAPCPPTSFSPQKRFRAVYDYNAADEDEVSFQDGDTIINVQQIDDGWMYGTVERTGDTGMLPANYVEAI